MCECLHVLVNANVCVCMCECMSVCVRLRFRDFRGKSLFIWGMTGFNQRFPTFSGGSPPFLGY